MSERPRGPRRLDRRGARGALAIAALLTVVALAHAALARPGGGSSFGGSSGGHGGGGGGGDAELVIDLIILLVRIIIFLVELTADYPAIGIPVDCAVVIGIVVAFVVAARSKDTPREGWDAGAKKGSAPPPERVRTVKRRKLEAIREDDPSFSVVLFEDYVYALYAAVHEARGKGTLAMFAPFVAQDVRAALEGRAHDLAEVRDVIIGSLRLLEVMRGAPGDKHAKVTVGFELETNYTEVTKAGKTTSFYAVERWRLSRARTARSRKPEAVRIFACPNCGAPLSALRGRQCSYCQKTVDTGELDWVVVSIELVKSETRGPILGSDVAEQGTHLPTVVARDAQGRLGSLMQRDPLFTMDRFEARVRLVFAELQVAWSTREWLRARPYVSDQLFQMQQYWIDAYKRAELRNVTENARVLRIELASVTSDAYYDAITVRVHATGLDYTLRDDGRLVSGSRTKERRYTEYWTLIRGRGVSRAPSTERVCPNCGAPADGINMAGTCTHCNAKVVAGAFDWVLSRIEQDESYRG